MGLADRDDLPDRIGKAITAVLANQSASGSFGVWRPDSGDLWLDAYASDFLARARAQGYAVPDTAFRAAMDNLRNRVNYYPDFEEGGEDLAYALYVLAREGGGGDGRSALLRRCEGGGFRHPAGLRAARRGAGRLRRPDPRRRDVHPRRAPARRRRRRGPDSGATTTAPPCAIPPRCWRSRSRPGATPSTATRCLPASPAVRRSSRPRRPAGRCWPRTRCWARRRAPGSRSTAPRSPGRSSRC